MEININFTAMLPGLEIMAKLLSTNNIMFYALHPGKLPWIEYVHTRCPDWTFIQMLWLHSFRLLYSDSRPKVVTEDRESSSFPILNTFGNFKWFVQIFLSFFHHHRNNYVEQLESLETVNAHLLLITLRRGWIINCV